MLITRRHLALGLATFGLGTTLVAQAKKTPPKLATVTLIIDGMT